MISVIVPVYNEQEVIAESYKQLKETCEKFGEDYELVFVNDGSRDNSLEQLRGFAAENEKVKVLSFSRNFGHQAAVTCGMKYCKGDCAVIIDADLQDPPRVILEMIEKWKEGYEIVYGKRKKREGETAFKKLTAYLYYRIVGGLSEFEIPKDSGDFRLIDRKVIDAINGMPEHNRYLRGMNAFVGYKTFALEYEREARFAGETKYTMKKMVKLASDGIISNSNKPLNLALGFGIFFGILGVLGMLTLIVLEILVACGVFIYIPQNLWTIDVVVIALAGMLVSNGITNQYVARIYDEVKNRPTFIVDEKINLD